MNTMDVITISISLGSFALAIIAIIQSHKSNKIASKSNETANEANKIAKNANRIMEDANKIAVEANASSFSIELVEAHFDNTASLEETIYDAIRTGTIYCEFKITNKSDYDASSVKLGMNEMEVDIEANSSALIHRTYFIGDCEHFSTISEYAPTVLNYQAKLFWRNGVRLFFSEFVFEFVIEKNHLGGLEKYIIHPSNNRVCKSGGENYEKIPTAVL